jgi:hypothetical protein
MAKLRYKIQVQDFKDYVFLVDLSTIVRGGEHTKQKDIFLPRMLDFIIDIHLRGAKIAITSQEFYKTELANAALNKLKEIRIHDVPYFCLVDALREALKTDLIKLEYYSFFSWNKEVTFPNPNIRNYAAPETKIIVPYGTEDVATYLIQQYLYPYMIKRAIGRDLSLIMGELALKKLGFKPEPCHGKTTLCIIAHNIASVRPAQSLREKYHLREVLAHLIVSGGGEEEIFRQAINQAGYGRKGDYAGAPDWAYGELITKLRRNGLNLSLGLFPPDFSDEQALEIARQASHRKWEELFKIDGPGTPREWQALRSNVISSPTAPPQEEVIAYPPPHYTGRCNKDAISQHDSFSSPHLSALPLPSFSSIPSSENAGGESAAAISSDDRRWGSTLLAPRGAPSHDYLLLQVSEQLIPPHLFF